MSRPAHYRVAPREGLTERQREVLELMAKGRTNAEIAEALGITLDGAKFHVSEILSRLDVGSREEAVAAWREGRRPVARLRGLGGLVTGKVALAGAAVAVAAVAVGTVAVIAGVRGGDDGDGPSLAGARTNVTVEEVVAAMRVPGRVVYIEIAVEGPDGERSVNRGWHYSDEETSRTEHEVNGVLGQVMILVPGRKAMFFPGENQLLDGPLDPSFPNADQAVYEGFPHLMALLEADEVEFRGAEILDGELVVRLDSVDVRTEDEVYEEPVGTTNRASIYLRNDDLLPVRLEFSTFRPGEGTFEGAFEVTVAEHLDPASLPPRLLDPDTLGEQRLDDAEALEIASEQPFETFWLGPRLDVPWQHPAGQGADYQEVMMVSAPGLPGHQAGERIVTLSYGLTSLATTLIDIRQGPRGSFEPVPAEQLAAIRAGGNVTEMDGDEGYFYVEYMSRGTCDFERAQRDAACQSGGRYGAVLERDGTLIHIVAAPKYSGPTLNTDNDTNPFSSAEAIRELVELLQPIP